MADLIILKFCCQNSEINIETNDINRFAGRFELKYEEL